SRTNLLRILNDFSREFDELRELDPDRAVEVLRKRINIEITSGSRGRDTMVPYFRITYQDRDPRLAQRVTDRLATFFIEQDTRMREAQVFGSREFIETELTRVRGQLQQVEDSLARLKERYRYELPDQLDVNLRTLDRLQEELKANQESRDRFLTTRLNLERMLSETPPYSTRQQLHQQTLGPSGVSPLVEQYRQKELELAGLLTRYTEQHPDVQRLRAELERLRRQIPPEDLVTVDTEPGLQVETVREPNPTYQQLLAQLDSVRTELRILEERRQRIENEIDLYRRRVDNTPKREQEVAVLERQYNALRARYEDLESKLTAAQLASSAESRQKGETLQVVDPANLPTQPAKPNRWLILAVGLGIALGVGVATALAVDFLDQKLWSAGEVIDLLSLPVIGEIPAMQTAQEIRTASRIGRFQAAGYVVLVALCAAAVYLVYRTPRVREFGVETLAKVLGW
ncbi:MAG TPA: GNVR domain-containing protein, partial [Acidobacteriota bacterium]|nr:GNVR domain-containing protein [Acidobacteriota bacterium]